MLNITPTLGVPKKRWPNAMKSGGAAPYFDIQGRLQQHMKRLEVAAAQDL
jgi:hypothetical protein